MIVGTEFMLEDIEAVWPAIEGRAARSRSSPEALLLARSRCASGHAICLANPDVVVVLTLKQGDGARIRAVVLLAVSTGLFGAFERQISSVVEIARSLEADELAFETDRPRAWRRLLGPEWAERDGIFARSL